MDNINKLGAEAPGQIKKKKIKHQATSNKRQASSLTDPGSGTIKDLESRKL